MTGLTTSVNTSNGNGVSNETSFQVKKPTSNSSLDIRNSILTEHFGYTEADIKALDKFNSKYFVIKEEKNKTPNRWAISTEVARWKPDSKGNLTIPIDNVLVRNLQDFRERRIVMQIFYAAGLISDSKLRAEVSEYLIKILGLNREDRSSAISELILITTGKLDSATEVLATLNYLTENAGYQDNPFIILAKANAAMTRAKMLSGPGYDVNVQLLLAETINKTNGSFNLNSGIASISRTEAAFINRHVSWLYNQLGNDENFRERDWVARFTVLRMQKSAILKKAISSNSYHP